MFYEVVRFFLQHKGNDLEIDASQRKYVCFLGVVHSRSWLGNRLGPFESEIETGEVGCWCFGQLLTLGCVAV